MSESTNESRGVDALVAKMSKTISNNSFSWSELYLPNACFPVILNVQGYTLWQLSQLNVQMHCDCFLIVSNSCPLQPPTSGWLDPRAPGWQGSYLYIFPKLSFFSNCILVCPGVYIPFFPFFWSNQVLPAVLPARGQGGKKSSSKRSSGRVGLP